jgi:sucrose phosphorylase
MVLIGVVVTETNVPEQENLSYLRNGQEAHLAYNFPCRRCCWRQP